MSLGNRNAWKGGRGIMKSGYIRILVSQGAPSRYRLEHDIVMEKHLGRPLSSDEMVHHIDGNRQNNELSNLLLTHQAKHNVIHGHEKDLTNNRTCPRCSSHWIAKRGWHKTKQRFRCKECNRQFF